MLPRQRMAVSHVIYSSGFFALTLAFAVIALIILAFRFTVEAPGLSVAVGPAGETDAKLIAAIASHLNPSRDRLKLLIHPTQGPAESAAALEKRQADLAVIRSDVAAPPNGATIVILHTDVVVFAAVANAGIKKVGDIAKKRVGVFPPTSANAAILDAVLNEYKIAPSNVAHIMVASDDLTTDIKKQVDALFIVAPLRNPAIARAMAALATDKHAAVLVPIDAAEGMAARDASYQKADIAPGFFRGAPPQPKDDVATLAVATRLEARQSLSEQTVTDLTKRLFGIRRAVQAEMPIASIIEKPDSEKGGDTLHPGASAYYDNNEKSFMDRYGDWIYIGAMGFSGLISALTALVGIMRRRTRQAALSLIDRLAKVKQEAHQTTNAPRLRELETEVENVSSEGVRFAREHDFDSDGLSALRLAIDEARLAIRSQYEKCGDTPLLTHAPAMQSPLHEGR